MIVSSDEFIKMLEREQEIYEAQALDFNDEIVGIEYIGEQEMMDISVSNNQLFYANGILIHNCATNNLEADNSAVSDSMGSVMTADFLMFLLQTEEMKEKGDIICKITKNRYTGKTETFPMRVNYELMRFEDPEIPKSLEARKEMKDLFETNVQQVEQILEEHHRIDKENAKALDQKMREGRAGAEAKEPVSATQALEVIDEWANLFN
mgnify:CR=1 FL=1